MNIILLGAPGAGKGTQAEMIESSYMLKHISTGEIFRHHIRQRTEIGEIAHSFIKKGHLVPDEITLEIVKAAIDEAGGKDVMLDGFPRNINQAEQLDKVLNIDKVIDIAVDIGVLTDRICGRRHCLECGFTAHISTMTDTSCPKCGLEMVQRMDDKLETVKERLNVYFKETAPLIEYYEKQKKLYTVYGTRGQDEVFEAVKRVLDDSSPE